MPAIQQLAIVLNANKSDAQALCDELCAIAKTQSVGTVVIDQWPLPNGFLKQVDACCVIGGDGTLLGAVPEAVRTGTPIFGINRGKLGFLATINEPNAKDCLTKIFCGDYIIQERDALCCTTVAGQEAIALNDVVIKHHSGSSLVGLEVFMNDELVTDYFCDGLVFTTATGSTAYNLSAGGPILHPSAQVFCMTPVCPHTLTNRSVIFSRDSKIRVELVNQGQGGAMIATDGREITSGGNRFPLRICASDKPLKLIQMENYSHFSLLRKKLRWG